MGRQCVLDIGTNSTRFLCGESSAGEITPSNTPASGTTITRLGEGVDETGSISTAAIGRVLSVVEDFNRTVESLGANWAGGIATSACRRADPDSVNDLFDGIEAIIGVRPELISGNREAELTYKGILVSTEWSSGTILDIGGGSTEWIVFEDRDLRVASSIEMGVVTLNERCVTGDRYTEQALTCMDRELESKFEPDQESVVPLVCVGGTGTTLASMTLELEEYDPERVHGYELSMNDINRQLSYMLDRSFEELSRHPMVQPGREDVIVPGIKILKKSMDYLETDVAVVSDFGILAGYLSESMSL